MKKDILYCELKAGGVFRRHQLFNISQTKLKQSINKSPRCVEETEFEPSGEAGQGDFFFQQILTVHQMHEPAALHLIQEVSDLLAGVLDVFFQL